MFVGWVEQIFQRNVRFSFDTQSREPRSQVEFTKRCSHFFLFKSHAQCFEKHSNVMFECNFPAAFQPNT